MRSIAYLLVILTVALPLLHPEPSRGFPAMEKTGTVRGMVRVDGDPPAAQTWNLDDAMRKVCKDEVATDHTWLVGKDKGLANCMVSLHPQEKPRPVVHPLTQPIKLKKEGWHFSPRVLVCTPGTKFHYTNTNSPCLGFRCGGKQTWNEMIAPGKNSEHVLEAPGIYPIDCLQRPYMVAWVHVVDTPYFAVTDQTGNYSISGLPPGRYSVIIWHEAGKLSAEPKQREVNVAAAVSSILDFKIKPR